MKPVWIVDDDRSIRWVIEKALGREGIAFHSFSTAQEALDALAGWMRAFSSSSASRCSSS